ncbi:MAG: phosphatase, partial [Actinomycetota bacterium]
AMVHGGMAGVVSHPLDNVLWKIGLLCEGDERSQFGLRDVCDLPEAEVMRLVAEASGWTPEPAARFGPFRVAAEHILEACEQVGERLALACERQESVILATGHPTGLPLLYIEVGRELVKRGVELLTPFEGKPWQEGKRGRREIRYFHGVAMLIGYGNALHTHSAHPMEMMLAEGPRPDLVFADHGFAGGAIEAGVDTVSIADVNDPALIVAKALGRTEAVIVMDDNVQPEAYWPCFQAIAARLPQSPAR